jgi:hypothetical protein
MRGGGGGPREESMAEKITTVAQARKALREIGWKMTHCYKPFGVYRTWDAQASIGEFRQGPYRAVISADETKADCLTALVAAARAVQAAET